MSRSCFEIGPGIDCVLTDTEDGLGVRISLHGAFRTGGLSHEDISHQLIQCFAELDIDMEASGHADT